MTAILLPSGRLRYHAYINGVYGPAVGYKLYTYAAGTTTPKATYADSDMATPLANPIVLDANGECAPYGTGVYKLLLTDPAGATVDGWPQDNVILSNSAADEEWCGTAGGTANALTLSPTVGISAYGAGDRFSFIAAGANSGAVTVNVSSVGSVALTKNGNSALEANDLQAGKVYQIQYDGVRFQLANDPRATLTVTAPDTSDDSDRVITSAWVKDLVASDTQAGISELATSAEYTTGTDAARVLTVETARAANLVRPASKSASGTAVDFDSIPSWAKRITVMVADLSTNGTSVKMLRIGDSGGIENTNYLSSTAFLQNGLSVSVSNYTDGFSLSGVNASDVIHGVYTLVNVTGNQWAISGNTGFSSGPAFGSVGGSKTLSGTLDRIRITTTGGTNTFDAGTVAIIYE